VIYLDTSAILKLLRAEPETDALRNHLETHAEQDLITSALATVETARALIASNAAAIAASAVPGSDRIDLGDGAVIPAIAIIEPVLDLARTLPPAVLRSLDAIHLATAKFAGDELDHVITYDKRMIAAANAAGLRTASPS
jgi:predicted nucleic acid-binding protein